jgi:hypothetical protein
MNRYIIAATAAIALVFIAYVFNFSYLSGRSVSDSPEAWAWLGDYVGGLLSPFLTFISLVLLIKSLALQNEANLALREEREDTRKTEKLRSFEAQLFNMVHSLKESLDSFKLTGIACGSDKKGVEAFLVLEKEIEQLVESGETPENIETFLEKCDETDQIFALTRMFYNMVKMINEKLSNENGFTVEDRKTHYLTLINFTDFALLRLIMMSAQFLSYQSTNYLKENIEFTSTLHEVGLSYQLYQR